MSRRSKNVDEQLPIFGHAAVKEAIEEENDAKAKEVLESKARIERFQAGVVRIQASKSTDSYLIRVHPFDKHAEFERCKQTEVDTISYVEKLKGWLRYKPKPVHILIEKNSVVWRLLSLEGSSWEEERHHD